MANKLAQHNMAELDELQNNLKNYLQDAATKGTPVSDSRERHFFNGA
jgi:hypothetical protein